MQAFDLDGTLIDSKEAVIEAYKAAGINPPPGFWGKPFRTWCPNHTIHDLKNLAYPGMLRKHGKRLHAADLVRSGDYILTGASGKAALAATTFLMIPYGSVTIIPSLTVDEKIQILNDLPDSVYYDDDQDAIKEIRERTTWKVVDVQSLSSLRPGQVSGL